MCGIAGIWSPGQPPDRSTLQAMIGALAHRGPDGEGFHLDGPVGLAHARLAIIDLAGGAQPLCNEDGSVWVTFNGEIFNYVELRQALLARGHRFATQSDTEVLVHLYEEHGDDFVTRLNGQFAFALWDARRQRLLLARDHVGIRPLFYARIGRQLAFASEAKALFRVPGMQRGWNPAGLASVFSWWTALPPDTVFAGVDCLPPGHRLVVDAAGERLERWWSWPAPAAHAPERSADDLAEELHALMVDAVRLQLRSDVPVGAYLSGGLDSSIITTVIRRHSDAPLRSFSLSFDDAEFDESGFQRELAAHLGTDHSEVSCSRTDIAASFRRAVWHAETPLVRAAPTPMLRLADSVRAAGYKVVLTGEGADEVFAGYDIFKEARVRRFMGRQPASTVRPRLLERLYPYLAHSPVAARAFSQRFFLEGAQDAAEPWFAHAPRLATTRRTLAFFKPEWREQLMAWDPYPGFLALLPAGVRAWPALARDQAAEATSLMSNYLLSSQGDRMAMGASIEARYPFLDPRIIEFGARLPARMRLNGLDEKWLLKRAFARELPTAISQRSKQPYRVPDSSSFFAGGKPLPWVEALLSADGLRGAGLFDAAAVGKLVAKCAAGRAIGFGDNMAFLGVLSTCLVQEQFIAPPAEQPPP